MALPEWIKADPVYTEIWNRVYKKDKNALIFVVGGTGDCKSGSSISMAYDLDVDRNGKRRFTLDRVVFAAQDFVRLATSNLPKGSCIVWDEVGVEADSREYYTAKNKLIKYLFQTMRFKNHIVFMTVPDINSVDIGVRKVAHLVFEMQGKVSDDMAWSKIKHIQSNPLIRKIYFKNLRAVQNGESVELKKYYIPRPPAFLEDAYKQKKEVSMEEMYTGFNDQLKYMNEVLGLESKWKMTTTGDLIDAVLASPQDFIETTKAGSKKFSIAVVMDKLGIGRNKAATLAAVLNSRLRNKEITLD